MMLMRKTKVKETAKLVGDLKKILRERPIRDDRAIVVTDKTGNTDIIVTAVTIGKYGSLELKIPGEIR